jgi:hypothetical protein
MQYLATELDFDASERHISCGPHTINLAVQSMMYGNKGDVDDILEEEEDDDEDLECEAIHEAEVYQDTTITAEILRRYRKSGPMGKLHNHGVCFNYSSQLVQAFNEAQVCNYHHFIFVAFKLTSL